MLTGWIVYLYVILTWIYYTRCRGDDKGEFISDKEFGILLQLAALLEIELRLNFIKS